MAIPLQLVCRKISERTICVCVINVEDELFLFMSVVRAEFVHLPWSFFGNSYSIIFWWNEMHFMNTIMCNMCQTLIQKSASGITLFAFIFNQASVPFAHQNKSKNYFILRNFVFFFFKFIFSFCSVKLWHWWACRTTGGSGEEREKNYETFSVNVVKTLYTAASQKMKK